MSNRRDLLVLLGAVAMTPRAVLAQSKRPVVIGFLSLGTRESNAHLFAALKEGLAALGWKDGSQIVIEERWADGVAERLHSLAKELAARKPAVLVANGARGTVEAAKGAPGIPIVTVSGGDPVGAGVTASFARPGGMVTGVTGITTDVSGKYLEFLLAAAPNLKRVGFLAYPHNPNLARLMDTARRSAAQHSVEARFAEAARLEDIEPALSRLAKEGAKALIVLPSGLFISERRRIVRFALAQRWPMVGDRSEWPEAGALLSYGADRLAQFRRAAYYVDRILKGAKPGDLPIEQATKFDLVINMKTAKALGITIQQNLLFRADKVIE